MRVLRFSLRRLALLVPVLLGTLLIAFLLTRILPGNPIERVAGPFTSDERRAEMKRQARLDLPFYQQFGLYLSDLVTRGDLGTSYNTAQPVIRDLSQRFPATLELVLAGLGLAVVVAIPLGILSALYKDSLVDHAARVISTVGVALPVFWLGLLLLYIFFLQLQWVPAPTGRLPIIATPPPTITGMYTLDALLQGQWGTFKAAFAALILPAVSLSLTAMAPLTRMTRNSVLEVLNTDYVRSARALGLPSGLVLRDYVFKNASIPVLTLLVGILGFMLGGVVLVETVFSWPGLGRYTLDAILASDFPAIQGAILLVTTLYVLLYLLLDIGVALIDPRVEVG